MKYFALIIFLSFTLFLTSCGEDNEEVPVTLPTTGKISGSVNLYNEGTDKISGSDMRISVSGTNISTLTNDQGSFQLADVPFGARTLSYEKTGYGTYKYFISDLSGNLSISATPSLGKLSPTKVITCAVTIEGDDIKISSVTDGTNTSKRYLRYFFGIYEI